MDHPRIRGEHHVHRRHRIVLQGSSPHTRGARQAILPVSSLARIIPAYAGSTGCRRCRRRRRGRDHPRIRGEHIRGVEALLPLDGSSPHTRGAPPRPRTGSPSTRIIPAYAGSTRVWANGPGAKKDHPRIRGEHQLPGLQHLFHQGSSPHTRGARKRHSDGGVLRRIIPAYAGSTRPAPPHRRSGGDHPRIRGEHAGDDDSTTEIEGSSPHTRGAPKKRL